MKNGLLRVAKNTLFVSAERGIEILVSIATIAIIARYLSVEQVGQYIFIVTTAGLLLMGSFVGLERILVRNISRNMENTDEYLREANTARNIMFIGVLFILSIVLFFMRFDRISLIATGIFIASEFLSYQGMTYMIVFKAYERMEYNTIVTVITKIITLGATVLAVYFDLGFVSIFFALVAGNLFKTTTAFLLFRKICPRKRSTLHVRSNHWKEFIKESYLITFSTILTFMCLRMDVFILKAFSTLKDVAFFQISLSIIMQMYILPQAITSAFTPMLSREISITKEINRDLIEKLLTLLLIVGFPITVLGFYYAPNIIHIIYGDKYMQAVLSFKTLTTYSIFVMLCYFFETLLISIEKQTWIVYGWVFCFIVNLILGLIFVPFFGHIGASVAITLAFFCLCVFLYFSLIWFIPVKIGKRTIVKIFSSVSLMILYLWLSPLSATNSLLLDITNALITTLFYLVAYFSWDISTTRETLRNWFLKRSKLSTFLDSK